MFFSNTVLYPLLGGLFFQSSIFIQACLIPVFFGIRSWFEIKSDKLITNIFGSDYLPILNFMGCMLHESCLSLMITSIKHPLVFVTLVLADVFENAFCLWSLRRSKTNRVVPLEDDIERGSSVAHHKKSLTKRSSSFYSLAKDLRESSDDESSEGTALFIAATLLQREMVETIVPMQAAFVMTILYKSGVRSNSVVSNWDSEEDFHQALMYIGIDLAVELFVFAGSILALRQIYPTFSAFRILMGLVRTTWIVMFTNTTVVWLAILLFQNTLSGLDLSLQFEWLGCDGENATWVGGFDWENC